MYTKDKLIRLSKKTTFHGVSNIIQARNYVIKLVWIFCFIISFIYCIITIKQNMETYFNYKTKSKIETIQIKKQMNIKYPLITICNLEICGFRNYDYFTFLNKFKKKDKIQQFKNKGSQGDIINERMQKINIKRNFFEFGQKIFLKYSDQNELDNLFFKKNFPESSQLISCVLNSKENCRHNFVFFRLGLYRDCYQFNFEKNWNDLIVEFYLGKEIECRSPFSSTSGQYVFIHGPSYTLTEGISTDILIEPGTHTSIGIDLVQLKKLSEPFSDCFDKNSSIFNDKRLIDHTIDLIGIYEQDYCLELCHQYVLIDICNCYDGVLSKFKPKNIKKCSTLDDSFYSCEHLVNSIFYNDYNDNECMKSCPKECEFLNYSPHSISKSKYPKKDYLNLINMIHSSKENESSIFENSRLTSINIYIDKKHLTLIKEYQSYSRLRLIGDIGGALGLFLGISFISLAEIGDILMIILSSFISLIILKIRK